MAKKLYVGNLTYNVNESDLEALFSQFGTVQSAQIIVDRDTNRSKGFGFVEMDTDAQAQAAIQGLHEQEHDGRRLTVNEAKPREARGGGGGYGGGGGGGGYRGAPPGGGDGGPMRDRRADFSGGGGGFTPPPAGGVEASPAGDKSPPRRREFSTPDRKRADYEPRKRGFDDDQ